MTASQTGSCAKRWRRFSLRSLFLIIAALAVILIDQQSPAEYWLAETHDPNDIAIDGVGFFQVLDSETQQCRFTRRGKLVVNEYGQACIVSGAVNYPLEPPVCTFDDFNALQINERGEIFAQLNGKSVRSGQLQLRNWSDDELDSRRLDICRPNTDWNRAIYADPGTFNLGTIRRGWIEKQVIFSATRVYMLSVAALMTALIFAWAYLTRSATCLPSQ